MAKIYGHSNFAGPREELKRALENPTRGRFIFVIGPSGVGKTTVRHALVRSMFANCALWGAGRIPYIEVFALLDQNAYFNSKSFAESLMYQLVKPSVKWLRDADDLCNPAYLTVDAEVRRACAGLRNVPLPNIPEPKLWSQFRQFADERDLWLAAIDQAHAMCTNHRDKSPADHILNLMSILEQDTLNILLSGVHSTANLWIDRPEVRVRSTVIWMPPYSHDRKQDRDPFLKLLRTLGEGYTFSKPTLLYTMAAELMAASGGIFGVLKKILLDAKSRAESAGRLTITKADITNSYYGEVDYKKMWGDVRFFEEVMRSANTKDVRVAVSDSWGLREKPKPEKAPSSESSVSKEA